MRKFLVVTPAILMLGASLLVGGCTGAIALVADWHRLLHHRHHRHHRRHHPAKPATPKAM